MDKTNLNLCPHNTNSVMNKVRLFQKYCILLYKKEVKKQGRMEVNKEGEAESIHE